ncbi:hypothetical protein [Mycetocola zhadangensis]|uniref:Phospholipase n=1 Tax=Mycetocola zhadangensis TaxID=1164595 RepID=A0A3L7J6A2_9MICO|nr:hypothetical protein [Mycetocola zhadangensis]RLQ86040.1 hypothetical protein D9V28_04150 [Mycetocola zhadangensis]GGE87882.1 hypothetical protein GCM10011313_08150 [Mycetocola zhadangensis]
MLILKRFTRAQILIAAVVVLGVAIASFLTIQANVARVQSIATGEQIEGSKTQLATALNATADTVSEARANQQAEAVLAEANQVIVAVQEKVDTTPLAASVASLASYASHDGDTVLALAASTQQTAAETQAAAVEADRLAAEAAAAAAAAAAEAQRVANTPDGARATARALAQSSYGWGEAQFSCLDKLWQKESGWSYTARNASSGATGIPQSLPGSKMASAGSDWATNASTQVKWGLDYIQRAYGSPCSAWSHSQSVNWY